MNRGKIHIICGPTASGKSKHAIEKAHSCNGIIINADSMQVYKGLEIITAQPNLSDMKSIEHYLYGYIDIQSQYSVGVWVDEVKKTIEYVMSSGKTPILVGGTGMYINAVINGIAAIPDISSEIRKEVRSMLRDNSTEFLHEKLSKCDSSLALKLNKADSQRITRALEVFYQTGIPLSEWQKKNNRIYERENFFVTFINPPREDLYSRINKRFLEMLDCGLLEEVKKIACMIESDETKIHLLPKAIGLREMLHHVIHKTPIDEAVAKSQQLTRNYAKRQITWFKNQLSYDQVILA